MTPGGPFPPQSERVFPLLTLLGQSSEIINPGYSLTRDSSPALTFPVQTPLQRAALEAWAQGLPDASAEAKHGGTGPLEPRLQLGFYPGQERVTEGRAAPANTHPDDLPALQHQTPNSQPCTPLGLLYSETGPILPPRAGLGHGPRTDAPSPQEPHPSVPRWAPRPTPAKD